MKTVRMAILSALVPLVCTVGAAHAQGQGIGHNGSYGPRWDGPVKTAMDTLTPQQSNDAIPVRSEMMQTSSTAHEQSGAKMDNDFMQSSTEMQKRWREFYRGH
ncbi:hypothetical protein [Burkholderia sp. PU8-34]